MKLGYAILYVQDVRSTVEFYLNAFGFKTRFVVPTYDYGELDIEGGTTLAFAAEAFVETSVGPNAFRPNRKDDLQSASAEISFVADKAEDVNAAYKKAFEAGVAVVKEPTKKPWGQIVGHVKNCNGFLVEICSPASEGNQRFWRSLLLEVYSRDQMNFQ